jgi:hypothetical protein
MNRLLPCLLLTSILFPSYALAASPEELERVVAVQAAEIANLKSSLRGLIGQFVKACPAGWYPADGKDGRVDLRGVFVRGINDFGSGTRADVYGDPENRQPGSIQVEGFKAHDHVVSSAGDHNHTVNAAGNHTHSLEQAGAHSHIVQGSPYTHSAYGGVNKLGMWTSAGSVGTSSAGQHGHGVNTAGDHTHTLSDSGSHSHTISASGGVETRPDNVGVIFCIKS